MKKVDAAGAILVGGTGLMVIALAWFFNFYASLGADGHYRNQAGEVIGYKCCLYKMDSATNDSRDSSKNY